MAFAVKAYDEGSPFTLIMELDGNDNPVYVGEADPGTSSNAGTAKWRIKKITYSAGQGVTNVQWASGDRKFNKDWSLRTSYTYS